MGIVLEIPELEPVVGEVRARYDWTSIAGFPPHVTLVGGTLYEGPTNHQLLQRAGVLAAVVGAVHSFSVHFSGFHRYPGALVLPVDPHPALASLAADVSDVCGISCRRSFHSTLARADDEVLDAIQKEIAPRLPVVGHACRVSVIGGDGAGGASGVLASWVMGDGGVSAAESEAWPT